MDSNDARLHWRDVLDAGAKGLDIVITRYNKPVSVVIDYEDYLALVENWRICVQRGALRPRLSASRRIQNVFGPFNPWSMN